MYIVAADFGIHAKALERATISAFRDDANLAGRSWNAADGGDGPIKDNVTYFVVCSVSIKMKMQSCRTGGIAGGGGRERDGDETYRRGVRRRRKRRRKVRGRGGLRGSSAGASG